VHLLEERREIFGLGDPNLFSELEQPGVIGAPETGGREVWLGGELEGVLHPLPNAELITHHARALGVGFEAGNVVLHRVEVGWGHEKGFSSSAWIAAERKRHPPRSNRARLFAVPPWAESQRGLGA
jgi:hypothetical protein